MSETILKLRKYGGYHQDDVECGWYDDGAEKKIIADMLSHIRELRDHIAHTRQADKGE